MLVLYETFITGKFAQNNFFLFIKLNESYMKMKYKSDTNFKYWQKKADKRFFILALLSCRLFLFQQ
jgi:hypothetical protein